MGEVSTEVLRVLREIPGVVGVASLNRQQLAAAIQVESDYERSCTLRVHNLGVTLLANHAFCVVLLKDSSFRPPRQPTVYLVEERDRSGSLHQIEVAGRRFEVVGQEVVAGGTVARPGGGTVARPGGGTVAQNPAEEEAAVPVDDSFVIFPDRRSDPSVPCFFLLPPLPFPELESRAPGLGIRDIISVSPSLAADNYVRDQFDFPPTNILATILIGFDSDTRPGSGP